MADLRRPLTLLAIGAISLGLVAMFETPRAVAPPPSAAPLLRTFYAAPVEQVQTRELRPGETLAGLLSQASITGADLADLLLSLREHRNPRTLHPGVEVTVRRWVSNGEPRAVEVRLNRDSTLRLVRADAGWDSRVVVTPTHLDTVYAAGRIDDGKTVYESILENDALKLPVREREELVAQLAEVFQYQLDFSREIQPGDSYRFVYEREARPDGSARSRHILAAEVRSQDKPYYAIYFRGGSDKGSYYDLTGKPLRRGFSRYPVEFIRITSRFSWRRYHPILGIFRAHLGTDYGAPIGTPVHATSDGVVVRVGWEGGYGNMVILRHSNGYTTRYGHLSRFRRGLHRGQRVSQGQVIGYVGTTGLSTGPHLHYEIRDASGHPVNPGTAKLPPSGMLSRTALQQFRAVAASRLELLRMAGATGGPHLAQGADAQLRSNGPGE